MLIVYESLLGEEYKTAWFDLIICPGLWANQRPALAVAKAFSDMSFLPINVLHCGLGS